MPLTTTVTGEPLGLDIAKPEGSNVRLSPASMLVLAVLPSFAVYVTSTGPVRASIVMLPLVTTTSSPAVRVMTASPQPTLTVAGVGPPEGSA